MRPNRTWHAAMLFPWIAAGLGAQTYQWSPPNTAMVSGGANNTIPFWSASASYQQVHDRETMGPQPITLKGIGMRPAGNRTITGRSWDLWLRIGHTSISALNAGPTFSSNFGAGPATTVFGSSSAYKAFQWPTFTSNGTAPAFLVPFDTSFLYAPAQGNLCWDWRQRNASDISTISMDASSGNVHRGVVLPSVGTGCVATGRTIPAVAAIATQRAIPSSYPLLLEVSLDQGAPRTACFLAVAAQPTRVGIGWCAPVVSPLLVLSGTTDSSGSFVLQAPMSRLAGLPPANLYVQFAFADLGLPAGIGLTDVAGFTTPAVPGAHGISRVYASTFNNPSNGEENAAVGSVELGFGLSVAWQK
ncbi:MAG: hypothetical protein KDC87_00085 [Planctomycetes bacterium]|nr:hypothetical protein [Planctomycetota bacterium]